MFSTFVGLGRFINCQRPDNTISTERCQTLFENILKNFFERIYVVFDKGAAAGTQPAAAFSRVKSPPEKFSNQ